ncbi:MAG: Gfo/Idh/MocA family oxidoreductase [Rhodothermales bacterium]
MREPTPISHPPRARVGLGGHGRTPGPSTCEAAPAIQVVAVCDPNDAERDLAAARFGAAAYADFDALIADDAIEAVALITPNFLHRQQAEAAFARGLHVFVEKPIANTVADGEAMAEAARRAGRYLMVGHNQRFTRAARRAKERLDAGDLGQVVAVEIHYAADNATRMPADAWRLDPTRCPLLPVMQLGVHAVDLVHYLIGPITSVAAQARTIQTPPGVVDSVAAAFTLPDGALGTMVSTYCTEVRFEVRISGTLGTMRCKPNVVWFRRTADNDREGEGPAAEESFWDYRMESFLLQMQAFGEAIQQGIPPAADAGVGLSALRVVEAMDRSAREAGAWTATGA